MQASNNCFAIGIGSASGSTAPAGGALSTSMDQSRLRNLRISQYFTALLLLLFFADLDFFDLFFFFGLLGGRPTLLPYVPGPWGISFLLSSLLWHKPPCWPINIGHHRHTLRIICRTRLKIRLHHPPHTITKAGIWFYHFIYQRTHPHP